MSMRKLIKRFPSATDRDFFYWKASQKEEFEVYLKLRVTDRVRTPDEFRYVHLKRNREMCCLMRWYRRSLNRGGVPYAKLPGNAHLTLHPGTAMQWIHNLALSKSFRKKWTDYKKPYWQKLISERKHSKRTNRLAAVKRSANK